MRGRNSASAIQIAPPAGYLIGEAWKHRKAEGLLNVAAPERAFDAWKSLLPYFGGRQATSITPKDCANYTAHRRAAGCAASTARRELAELKATCRFYVSTKRLPLSELPQIELPPRGAPRPHFLTVEQRDGVLAAARQLRKDVDVPTRLELFLVLGLYSGRRKQAIERLEWDQVCFITDTIHFDKEGDRVTRKRKGRLPMQPALRQFLQAERDRASSSWVLRNPGNIRTSFDNLMAALELDHVTPHTLRHTFISHLLMNSVDVYTVSKLACVTVAEIERTYGHLGSDHLRTALSTL